MSQVAGNYRRAVTIISKSDACEQFANHQDLGPNYPKHDDAGIDIIQLGTIVSIASSCGVFD